MKKVLLIGAGGFIGAILRYLAGKAVLIGSPAGIFSTLTVNVAGCFILSIILSEAFRRFKLSPDIRLGIATGLLGAFTTFSTLCREVSRLIYGGSYLEAILYAAASLLLGIIAVFLGTLASKRLASFKPLIDTDITAKKCRDGEEA